MAVKELQRREEAVWEARTAALQLARADFTGAVAPVDVINRARLYESYLLGTREFPGDPA